MSATLSNPLLDTDAFPPSSHQSYSTDDQELNELYAQKKPPSTSASSNHRLLSFDALRGLIMCIMAWDHSRDYISDGLLPKNSGSEFWNGPLSTYDNNPLLFLQRWLPHFCAPGFFWLMGIGMVFLTASRIAKGWSYWRIMRHFCIRGFLLLFLDRVVNLPDYVHLVNPSSFNSGSTHAFGPDYLMGLIGIFEVLTALGWTMIVCGLFMPMIHWAR